MSQPINQIQYTTKDGLPSNTVYCAVRDNQGFIWFGTDAGLSRFDGSEFKNFGLQEGLPDMEVLNFYKDSFGRIWIYTFNGKVCFIKDGEIYNSSNTPFLAGADSDSRITSIVEKDGLVFITFYSRGIVILNDSGVVAKEITKDPDFNYVSIIDDKYYWIVISRGLRLISGTIDQNKPIFSSREEHLIVEKIRPSFSYMISCDDDLIALTYSRNLPGIVKIDPIKNIYETKRFDSLIAYNLKKLNGDILLFTNEGVKKLHKESLEIEDYLNHPEITNLGEDAEGNIFFTTLKDGVFFRPKTEVVPLNRKQIHEVKALHLYNDSSIYLVYNDNRVGEIDNQNELSYLFTLENKSFPRSMYVDADEQVWTLQYAGMFVNGESFEFKYKRARYSYFKDSVLIFHADNSITYRNIFQKEEILLKVGKLGKIWDFQQLSQDEFLIASEKGLSIFNIKEISHRILEGFENIRITDIEVDKYGELWLASNGFGLMRMNQSSIESLTSEQIRNHRINSFSDVYTQALVIDSILYAATPNGVSKILFDENGVIDYYHISQTNGLDPGRVIDLVLFNDQIYVGQENGLFSFSHSEPFMESADFPLIIDEIVADDSTYLNGGSLKFPHDIDVVQITCKAVNYKHQDNLEYQFRLRGIDSPQSLEWNTSQGNEFIFSGLSPGRYTFQVRAKSINSTWTLPVSRSFEIQTIYWKTWWFKLLLISLVLAGIVFVYVLFTAGRRRRKILRQKKIESDLKALKAQINPHFIFNSMNSIQSFVLEEENQLAEEYLVKYGKLIRIILNHSNVLTVSIEEEMDALRMYVELEKLRMTNPFDFIVQTDSIDTQLQRVPSMIIQPLIENSIWHGIQPLGRPGEIKVMFEKLDKKIKVTIQDNGLGFKDQPGIKSRKPKGIQLVKERIELINKLQGYNASFEVHSNEEGAKIEFVYPSDLKEL